MDRILALVLFGSWASTSVAVPLSPLERLQREQGKAVAEVRRLGGEVSYAYQRPDPDRPNEFDPSAVSKNPRAFHPIVGVDFRDTDVTDDDLAVLAKFPWLENLNLSNTGITGAGLAHTKNLKHLKVLSLWNTRVGDEGLAHIRGLGELWLLVLDGTRVTDAGLVHLQRLTKLEEWLGLSETRVTDAGLRHLQGLAKLRSLNLIRTGVTAAGVRQLRESLPDTDISFRP